MISYHADLLPLKEFCSQFEKPLSLRLLFFLFCSHKIHLIGFEYSIRRREVFRITLVKKYSAVFLSEASCDKCPMNCADMMVFGDGQFYAFRI